jgi:hypothetical protein
MGAGLGISVLVEGLWLTVEVKQVEEPKKKRVDKQVT